MRKVMVATPSHEGVVDVRYAHSLYHSGRACAAHDIDLVPVFLPGESLIQVARNTLVRLAVEGNADDLVFIDADEEWEPLDLLALLRHRVDVVGAAVRKKTDDRELYNVRSTTFPIPVDETTGLWLVDSIGTGFVRLSRAALAALWRSGDEYMDDFGNVGRMVFDIAVFDGRLVSEDVAMCMKLRAAGFAIHLDPTFTVSHIGTKTYPGGDFRDWVARLMPAATPD